MMPLYTQYKNPIEQKINFKTVKFPRELLRTIRENFRNQGNVHIFTYITLLSLARKYDYQYPEIPIKNITKVCDYLKIDTMELYDALHVLQDLKLIRTSSTSIYISDYEANRANQNFKNPTISVGIKTNKGFIFVPKNSIRRILENNEKSNYSSADIVTVLFTELIFNDEFVPLCNRSGFAVCYFKDSCKTSFKDLADRFNKSKSTIHGILKKCERLSIMKAVHGKFKNDGTYIYSENYIKLFGWSKPPTPKGEFLEMID